MSSSGIAASIQRNVVHPLAKSAFTAVGSSGLYDRARPSYPDALVDRILSTQEAGRPLDIVEIGSGTGIFSRALLARPRAADIRTLTAVEPAEGMRQSYESVIANASKRGLQIRCIDGAFDDIEAETGTVDLVIAAQAFHWIGKELNAAENVMTEIGRVLKAGTGRLALIWNLEDRDHSSWVGAIRDLYEQYEVGSPQYRHMYWKIVYQSTAYARLFDAPSKQEHSVTRDIPATIDSVIERVNSKSYISALEELEREALDVKIREVLNSSTEKQWIDESQGVFAAS